MKTKINYFDQCDVDGKVFIEHFERYGVLGMLTALQNVVRHKPDRRVCTNKCSVTFNIEHALNKCYADIVRYQKEAS